MQVSSTQQPVATAEGHVGAESDDGGPRLVGLSEAIAQLRRDIQRVARRRCTVLIRGASGTGKELVARRLHALSPRRGGPFVPVDCTGLPEPLIESQLFGHVKGAFTGASGESLGFLRAAEGGVVFLDEIGDLPLSAQARLLRCIQERKVVPVGGVRPIPIDVRFIAATHRDVPAMVEEGAFRQDLYYRLHVVELKTPPLCDRPEDILLLADAMLDELSQQYAEPRRRLSSTTRVALRAHHWPGNVRELRHALEHALAFCGGETIEPGHLPETVPSSPKPHAACIEHIAPLDQVERELIAKALTATNGNKTQAAELIGVERHRLHRMVERHGLHRYTVRGPVSGASPE